MKTSSVQVWRFIPIPPPPTLLALGWPFACSLSQISLPALFTAAAPCAMKAPTSPWGLCSFWLL